MDGTGEPHLSIVNHAPKKSKVACFPSYVETRPKVKCIYSYIDDHIYMCVCTYTHIYTHA
jgi:hypothetical protein